MARLREELERLRGDDGHPHESGDECLSCERLATEWGWPYCNQCLLEHQLEFCNGTATEAITKVGQLHEELERLRELIPDAGLLYRLTKTAELWGEGGSDLAQGDIAAGYALIERLYEEKGDCPMPCDGCEAVLARNEICPLSNIDQDRGGERR